MSEHYEVESLGHKDGNFEVKVGYFYEDIHPSDLKINNIYPNPSNNSMTISFSVLSQLSPVEISIRNILGQQMYKTYITPKSRNINWTWDGTDENGFNAPSGSYFISISQKNISQTRKITLLK